MLVLMKQHGRTVLLVIAAMSALGILFRMQINGHTGFIRAVYGQAMEDVNLDTTQILPDVETVNAAAVRKKPEITFCCTKILPQTAVDLKAMLTAKDADGNLVDVEITDIVNEAGESVLYQTEDDRKNKVAACNPADFLFPAVGIYVMDVKAADREKKTAEVQFRIPVTGY